MELEIGTRVDPLEARVRVEHPIECDAVFRQRVHQPHSLPISQLAHVVDLQRAGRGR